jgi:DNA mismatch repair ATPase MutL
MKKLQGISGLSLVALLLVSCTSKTNVSTAPKQEPSVEPVSVAPNSVMPSPIQESAPKGLIPSTNPTTLPIAKGRIDPFSSVTVAPVKLSIPAETTQPSKTESNKPQSDTNQPNKTQPNKTQPDKTQPNKPQRDKTQPDKTQPNKPQRDKTQPDKTQSTKPQPDKAQPLPSTDLARAVEVKGVMQVGERLAAIVQESDEKISRSVSAGEYLSNGAVLVKRIHLGSNEEPLVILEQNGVEVIKPVTSNNSPVASRQ